MESKYWGNSEFKDGSAPDIVAWKLARSAIEHENGLVNQRMTWFFQVQGFLFAAFVLIFNQSQQTTTPEISRSAAIVILTVIAIFGAFTSAVTKNGLNRAAEATTDITEQYEALIADNVADPIVPPLHLWRKPKLIHQESLPIATLLVWMTLIAVAVLLQYGHESTTLAAVQTPIWQLGLAILGMLIFGLLIGKHLSRK